jgi:excisionase family DNA binding protein
MLTTKEISEMLNVSEETVRRWIRNEELKAKQEGKSYFVDQSDLLKFIEEKSKVSNTYLGKLDAILPGGIEGVIKAGAEFGMAAASGASKFLNKLGKKVDEYGSDDQLEKFTPDNLEEQITLLEMQKREIEIEYQKKLLEIDKEIIKYKKIKKQLSQVEGENHEL